MQSFNSIVLAGQLTRDPELIYTREGVAMCSMRLAVTTVHKGKDGRKTEETMLIDVEARNRTAEVAAQFLRKGRSVLVHGRLLYETWVDGREGERRAKHRVAADAIQFLKDVDKPSVPVGTDGAEDER